MEEGRGESGGDGGWVLMHKGPHRLQFARQHLKQQRVQRALEAVDPLLFPGYGGESHCNIHVA